MKKKEIVIPRYRLVRRYLDKTGLVISSRMSVYYCLDTSVEAYDRAVLLFLDGNVYASVSLYDGEKEIASCTSLERGFCGRKYCGNGYCSMCQNRGVI